VCAPAASAIFPASGIAGTTVTATISGRGLADPVVTVFGEPGLAATVQASADAAVTVRLDLDGAATVGERILLLETPGGSTAVSFTINAAGGPVVGGVSPPLVATRGVALDVTMSGAGLASLSAAGVTVSGTGVSVVDAVPTPDGSTLALRFAVDPAADLGTHAVVLGGATGSAVLLLYVQDPPPTISAVRPSAGEVGATVPLTLIGANLSGAALVVTGTGVAVSDVVSPDAGTLGASLTIDPATPPSTEPRLLIVTTESGQTTAEFFVVPAGVPTVTGIDPGAGEPGTTVPVTLRGLRLSGGTVSTLSPDLTLQSVTVVDDETITLEVVLAPGAAPDTDHTLTVTTAGGTADAVFRVIAVGDPFIGSASPPFGNRGSTITLFVHGVNLGLVTPGTGVDLSGPKIAESNAAAVDDRTVRATIAMDPTASVGYRDVTVSLTNGRSVTRTAAFRVNVPGTLPAITDVTPTVVEPGTTTPIQVSGSNFAGGAALVTGPGAVVSNIAVDATGTLMTFDLTLTAAAPAEDRSVVVVTENGTARCGIASNPAPPQLLAAKLVKTGALFRVPDPGFRLFVFEFSLTSLFPAGPRTLPIADDDGTLVLDRADTVAVGHAFRSRHRGWVRVRAVTATNRIALSAPASIRR
jgi:hypothetical protein